MAATMRLLLFLIVLFFPNPLLRADDPIVLSGHKRYIGDMAFSPDGKILASGSDDKTVRLWDVQTKKVKHVLEAKYRRLTGSIVFSPDGKWLTTANSVFGPAQFMLWSVSTGEKLYEIKTEGDYWVRSAVFLPDGRLLLGTNAYESIYIVTAKTGGIQRALPGDLSSLTAVESLAVSPKGKLIAAGTGNGNIRLWDVKTKEDVRYFKTGGPDVKAMSFSPDGKLIAAGGTIKNASGGPSIFDVATGKQIRSLAGHEFATKKVVFSPDGKILVSVGSDLIFWDINTGKKVASVDSCNNFAVSPDWTWLALAKDFFPGRFEVHLHKISDLLPKQK